jgi:catechol 2,3-dioxygenase-like lactoylglutathione lyase family enzyme
MPNITGVSHIELTVRDVDRSATWYQHVLGMQKLIAYSQHPTAGVDARIVHLFHPDTELVVGLMQHDQSATDDVFSEFRIGLDHLSFAVASRAELEAWAAHLETNGVEHSPIRDHAYGAVLVFRDPDNIQLELFVLNVAQAMNAIARAL